MEGKGDDKKRRREEDKTQPERGNRNTRMELKRNDEIRDTKRTALSFVHSLFFSTGGAQRMVWELSVVMDGLKSPRSRQEDRTERNGGW